MASIRSYRTAKGDRRYEVRYRDRQGGSAHVRSRATRTHRRSSSTSSAGTRPGLLYSRRPKRSAVAQAWLERFDVGAAGRFGPRPKTMASTRESLRRLAPLATSRRAYPSAARRGPDCATRRCMPRRAEMSARAAEAHPQASRGARPAGRPAIYRIGSRSPTSASRGSSPGRRSTSSSPGCPSTSLGSSPVAVLTMLRRGEILGLRDRDVDFEDGSICRLLAKRPAGRADEDARRRRTVDIGPPLSGSCASSSSHGPRTERDFSSRTQRRGLRRHNFMGASSSRPRARAAFRS